VTDARSAGQALVEKPAATRGPANANRLVQPDQSELTGAFEALFERELDWMMRTLRRLGVAGRDVEDVAQLVFLSVHGRFAELDPARPARPWLFAFAVRAAANHRKLARHRHEDSDGDVPAVAPGASPEEQVSRQEDRAVLLAALGELDLDRRAVIVMHDLDGMSAPVIAEALEIPINTVYSRIRLAREDLEKTL
jgi:RNA polymerase sigma-70 factor (ECF subfamily)